MSDIKADNPPPYNPNYPQPENVQPEYQQPGYHQPQNASIGYPQPAYAQPDYPQPMNVQVAYSTPGHITVHAPVVQRVPLYMYPQMGRKPAMLTCPSCNSSIGTRVEPKTASRAHIWALALFIIGCWPCCLIPYCMSSCQDADHYCPHCNGYIGYYKS